MHSGLLAEWTQNWFHWYARLQCCPGLRALEYFRWNQFLFCYVLTETGNLLDLWSFGRRLTTAQVSVRIGKGRRILRLYYPYIDVFRVRYSNCRFKKRQHPSVPLHFNAIKRLCQRQRITTVGSSKPQPYPAQGCLFGRDTLIGGFESTRIPQTPLVEFFAPVMLRKLVLQLQDRFSRNILEGLSSHSDGAWIHI